MVLVVPILKHISVVGKWDVTSYQEIELIKFVLIYFECWLKKPIALRFVCKQTDTTYRKRSMVEDKDKPKFLVGKNDVFFHLTRSITYDYRKFCWKFK